MTGLQVHVAGLALQTVPVAGTDLTLLTIFVGVIAACVLLITLALVGVGIALLRVKAQVTRQIDDAKRKAQPAIASVRAKVDPIIADVTEVVHDLKPKIRSISEDVAELSHTVRAQVTDLDSTLSDVTSKARSQVERVNGMVSSTLNTTEKVASNVEKGIKVPIREIAGLVNGVRAGLDVLTGRSRKAPVEGRYGGVPRGVQHEVHRAAEQARADAMYRTAEGQVAARHAGSAGPTAVDATVPVSPQGSRSMVEAGEEIVAGPTSVRGSEQR